MVKLTVAEKADYVFTADCGPGEENKTGLIVPKFGKDPEQHVSVILTWRQLNELLFTTAAHYNAWLSAKYLSEWGARHAQRFEQQSKTPSAQPVRKRPPQSGQAQQQPADPPPGGFGSVYGSVYGRENGRMRADDTGIF